MEILTELTVTLKGALWNILGFKIETIDVLKKILVNDSQDEAKVNVKKFPLSEDRILDIFIEIEAPNGTNYDLEVSGELSTGEDALNLNYKESFEVIRRGNLRISLTKNLNELLDN
ncbi:hypothetical protein LX87_05548 [Larkinella arboricola]|uniref:Uncharacterized protein n=1 Tax=Larkinella arboricola TaxID=643671 RepID=A0A327WFJ6_LARAB|nr:hypothetical protein [Larkinella arboricola]RAJ90069.1 hypothetical protein LX87_05548 [Larkinella arboricola]